MSRASAPPRPRPRTLRPGAFFFLVLAAGVLVGAAELPAQEIPPPGDTAAADTVPEAPPPPPPRLPSLDPVGPTGWEFGVWEWDRRALLMLPDVSLLDLLQRVPGITPVRVGAAGQPEGAAVLGAAAAGIRYILDGFELDPLTTPTFDPSRLSLLALERVRVERTVTGAVVRLETLSPTDPRPHSVVEAATGDVGVNLFRGIFLAPSVLGGPLAGGFERLASDAAGGSNRTVGWLKWTFVRDSAGIQLEYRQSETDRTGFYEGFLGQRRDWALRARARLLGVTTEAYAGATTVEDDDGNLVLREGTPQAGLRFHRAFEGPLPSAGRVALRFRDHPRLPGTEAAVELWTGLGSWLRVGAEGVRGWWDDAEPTGSLSARARLGPVLGFSAFGEMTLGDTPATRLLAPGDSLVLAPVREGLRVGGSFDRWGFHFGAAALRLQADEGAGFGVAFDPDAPRFAAGEAPALEALAVIPTGWEPLWLEAWYLHAEPPGTWLYLPDDQWRVGLVYHDLPLPSGNLEIYSRLEHVFRGPMDTPCTSLLACADTVGDPTVARIGANATTNFELTIRVVTVRAFFRWENVFLRRYQQDLPFGHPARPGDGDFLALPGQRFVYGIKWEFWN